MARLFLVTGTGTGVGKTITAAALTACALRAGLTVAVVKPVQTGVRPDEAGDLADIRRLTGHTDLHELARYPDPLAPATAARRVGDDGPSVTAAAAAIRELADRDLVIVEGAGGAYVRINGRRETLLDLGVSLQDEFDVEVLLVASSALGVLNVVALTAPAIARAGLPLAGVVVGELAADPGLAERCNLVDLSDYADAPILGILPQGAGGACPSEFADLAVRSLTPTLGGTLDAEAFIERHRPASATGAAHDRS
jgi:dethiobiotin synthetase